LNCCQGVGENPYYVNIIDYYGPGCKAVGTSKDWLAIIPEKQNKTEGKQYKLRYMNLD
jgi:hypothetical protein